MKYIVAIEGEEYAIQIGEGGEVSLNDAPRAVDLQSIDGISHFSLLIGPRSHDVFLERVETGYAVTVDGEHYSVQVEGGQEAHASEQVGRGPRKPEAATGPPIGAQGAVLRDPSPGAVTSPMTGVLVEILAGVGQRVEAGEGVAILEAMKTENVVRAPVGGSVKSIEASTGQSLRMDEVIMHLDPSEHKE
jgi:biotin carboxyl carrier protein